MTRSRWALLAIGAMAVLVLALLFGPGSGGPAYETRSVARPVRQSDPAGASPAAERDTAPDGIQLCRLPIRLLATAVRTDRAESLATFEDYDHPGTQILAEGESFRGRADVRISRIEPRSVVIDHAGMVERLLFSASERHPLEDFTGVENPEPVAVEELERRRAMADRLQHLTELGEDWREAFDDEREPPGGILAEGVATPSYVDGEMVGVELAGVREGGVYDRVGLTDGDVITSVNGVSLGDADSGAQLLGHITSSEQFDVSVVDPDGNQRVIQIDAGELFDLFAELE